MLQEPDSVPSPSAIKLRAWSTLEEAFEEVEMHFPKSPTLLQRIKGLRQLLEYPWDNLRDVTKERVTGYLLEVLEVWRKTDMGARDLTTFLPTEFEIFEVLANDDELENWEWPIPRSLLNEALKKLDAVTKGNRGWKDFSKSFKQDDRIWQDWEEIIGARQSRILRLLIELKDEVVAVKTYSHSEKSRFPLPPPPTPYDVLYSSFSAERPARRVRVPRIKRAEPVGFQDCKDRLEAFKKERVDVFAMSARESPWTAQARKNHPINSLASFNSKYVHRARVFSETSL